MSALLSVGQVAKMYGITGSAVRLAINEKRLKATRLGLRSWSIKRSDLKKAKLRKPNTRGKFHGK